MKQEINTTTLAFMGDAVYEVYVREKMIQTGVSRADRLHRMTVQYVQASAQEFAVKSMLDGLSEEEHALVRRARNRKPATKAKHASLMTYKWATAFEALIGWLWFRGEKERMEEIIQNAMEWIRSEKEKKR